MSTTVSSRAPRRAGLLILLLAYAGFVALGLSNSLMGVAWPSIRNTFGLPLDALGMFLIGNTTGYMLASAVSGRLMALRRHADMRGTRNADSVGDDRIPDV